MIKVIVGSYEGFIHGWFLEVNCWKADIKVTGKLLFGYQAHEGSVKCLVLANSGPRSGLLMVSGGVDEIIRIYDVEKRVEIGELQEHSGTITALEFFGCTHLLSGGEDNLIIIWRVYDWTPLHKLGGHKGKITGIACHPSGKLALSVSTDRTLRCWDLVQGRIAYITRVEGNPENLSWSPDGSRYVYSLQSLRAEGGGVENPVSSEGAPLFAVYVFTTGVGEPCGVAEYTAGHVEAVSFLDAELLAIAYTPPGNLTQSTIEIIRVLPLPGEPHQVIHKFTAGGRVRGLKYARLPRFSGPQPISTTDPRPEPSPVEVEPFGMLAAATSNGVVQAWSVFKSESGDVECSLDWTGTIPGEPRFTSLDLWTNAEEESISNAQVKKKKKRTKSIPEPEQTKHYTTKVQPESKTLKKKKKKKKKKTDEQHNEPNS